jgi:hypothetical protein
MSRRSPTADARLQLAGMLLVAAGGTAAFWVGGSLTVAIPAWWLVTVAQGDPNETLSLVAAIYGLSFVGAAIALPRLR